MDPFSAVLLGGSAIFGGLAQSQANSQNRRIADQNFQLAMQDRADRIKAAQEAKADARLGTTDQYGNRMYWDDARGWVTDLQGDSKQIAEAQLDEQLRSLLVDAPQRRRQEAVNERARGDERATSDALLDEFRRVQRSDPEAMRAMLYDRARMGIDEGYNDVTREAATTALRSGNSNIGAILASVGKSKASDLRKASLDAAIQAEDRADQRFNTQRSGVGNLYQAFADRASRLPSTAYQPMSVDSRTGGNIPAFASEAGVNSRALMQAFTNTPQMAYAQPNNAFASTLGQLGSIYGGYQQGVKADERYNTLLAALKGNSGAY